MLKQSKFTFMGEIAKIGIRLNVGIVGATGIVGKTLVRVLREREFPVSELHLYASPESEGNWLETPFGQLCVEKLNKRKIPHHELVFIAADNDIARFWGLRFAHRDAIVIDKSSYFRNKSYAPLIVPEVNADALDHHHRIIANPNCTTIPLVTALSPLHEEYELKGFTAVSFQSVSGAGKDGMVALGRELEDDNAEPTAFPHRIAYNVIPWIGSNCSGFSGEEKKMISETRRILRLPHLPIRATSVRVPVLIGHSLAVHADFKLNVNIKRAREILDEAPGVTLIDDPENDQYPMPLTAAGRDDVLVGRIRRDRGRHSLAFWISADNLRKGAATNAVQIAEVLLANKPLGKPLDNPIS